MFIFFLILYGLAVENTGENDSDEDAENENEEDAEEDKDEDEENDENSEQISKKEKEEEEDSKLSFTDYVRKIVSRAVMPEAHSKYAFVSVYSYDIQPHFGYLQMLLVLGYTLKTLSPSYDRVLIVWDKLGNEEQIMSLLRKVWSHIIIMPYIRWPTADKISNSDNAYWFKFYAWSLTQYEKVLFIGADTLVYRDISSVFNFEPPAAPYDMNDYTPFDDGMRLMHDYFLLKPDMDDFIALIEMVVPRLKEPEKYKWSRGSYDTLILIDYYTRDITIFPIVTVGENGGFKKTILQDVYHPTSFILNPAAHFASESKPWKTRMTIYSEVWLILASSVYEKIDVPFSAGPIGHEGEMLVQALFGGAADINRLKALSEVLKQEEEEDQLQDIYPDMQHSGTRKNVTMLFLVLLVSLLMLKSTLGTTNPFNVFINKIEERVDQFIRLDDAGDVQVPSHRNNNKINDALADAPQETSGKKKRKHRKHKKKQTEDAEQEELNDLQDVPLQDLQEVPIQEDEEKDVSNPAPIQA